MTVAQFAIPPMALTEVLTELTVAALVALGLGRHRVACSSGRATSVDSREKSKPLGEKGPDEG